MISRMQAVGFIASWAKLTGENRDILVTMIDCLGGLWAGDGQFREKIDPKLIFTLEETEPSDPTGLQNNLPRWARPGVHYAVAAFLRKLADALESGEEYI